MRFAFTIALDLGLTSVSEASPRRGGGGGSSHGSSSQGSHASRGLSGTSGPVVIE
jgi:hypothetical protein